MQPNKGLLNDMQFDEDEEKKISTIENSFLIQTSRRTESFRDLKKKEDDTIRQGKRVMAPTSQIITKREHLKASRGFDSSFLSK